MEDLRSECDSDSDDDGRYTSEEILLSMGFEKNFIKGIEIEKFRPTTSTDKLQYSVTGRFNKFTIARLD